MNQLLIKKGKKSLKRKKKGFTLIELIIVIAIIAVIASIAIPKFSDVKKRANIDADMANGKMIATAVASAVAEGEGIDSGVVNSTRNYVSFIDGKAVPTPKSGGASFYVDYTTNDGTKVFIDTDKGTEVYPEYKTADSSTGSGSGDAGTGSKSE